MSMTSTRKLWIIQFLTGMEWLITVLVRIKKNESINSEPEYYYDDKDVKKECKEYMIMKKLKIKESFGNRLYTRKELLNLISSGMGIDADNISKDELPVDYKILGHSEGTYGITGGVIEDNQTGDWYVFTKRTPNLYRIF